MTRHRPQPRYARARNDRPGFLAQVDEILRERQRTAAEPKDPDADNPDSNDKENNT